MVVTETTLSLASKAVPPALTALARAATGPVQRALQNWISATQLRKITKTLAKIENVKTLWSPDKEVSLYSFYYPSKILSQEQSQDQLPHSEFEDDLGSYHKIECIEDLPDGNVTIQGIVGQGKSIFLRYLASQSIRSQTSTKIPIFIELRTLTTSNLLRQAIYRVLDAIDVKINDDVFDYLARSGRLVLLLDAFDELQEDLINNVLSELDYLTCKYPDLRIIVTSRLDNEIQKVSGFQTVDMGPLLRPEFPGFLQKLGLQPTKRTELLKAIDISPSGIDQIIRTPLMLTLVVIVYESEREIPPTLSDFFERLFQVVFTRHDKLKAGFNRKHHSGLSERRLQLFFEAFCFMTLQSGYGRTLNREQFNQAFDRALKYTEGCQCEVEKFRLDITKVACLMLEEGIDLATFLHKSIIEYYASAFIAHSSDEVAKIFYSKALTNYKQWEAVINFLRDIDPYRFARDYTMQDAPNILATLEKLLKSRDLKLLLEFIETNQPRFSIAFRDEPSKERNGPNIVRAYGPWTTNKSPVLTNLPLLLMRAMEAAISKSSPKKFPLLLSEPTCWQVTEGDSVYVPCSAFINQYGSDEFWKAIESLAKEIKRNISYAQTIINAQDRRKLMFEKS